jgi:alpha-tubulin suppressor-like RCC1 family protein
MVTAWGRNDYAQTNVPPAITNVVSISSGAFHQLTLMSDGTVQAWGADYSGQSDVPLGLSNVMAVAAGGAHSLALLTNGTVLAWGYNAYSQTSVPSGLNNVVAIAGGWQHSLALKRDGTVVAWGNPSGGGPGNVVPSGLMNVTAIAASYHQNLALKSDGTVVAWGSDPGLTNVPAGLSNVVAVAAAYDANLALKSDGTVIAWGYGVTTTNLPPGLSNVVSIAGGFYNFAALKSDDSVVVWGDNANGQTNVPLGMTNIAAIVTGNGDCATLATSDTPQFFQQPQGMSALAETTALFVAGASGAVPLIYQWKFNGTNIDGATAATLLLTNLQPSQAGSYSVTVSNASGAVDSQPAQLTVIPFIASVTPGNQSLYPGDTLSVTYQGPAPKFFQWSFLGSPLPNETNASLVLNNLVTNQPNAYSVIVSNHYASSTLYSAVTTVTNRTPFFIIQPANAVVSPWGTVTFQAAANGSKPITYQWQFNGVDIPGATNATLTITNLLLSQAGTYSVRSSNGAGSQTSSNALLAILNVVTWGATNGALGVVPSNLTNAIAIAAGYHSLALKADGRVVAWGDNFYGQANVPASATNVVAIAAAYEHNIVLRSNGTVVAWGFGGTNVPTGLSNVVAIAAGDFFSMALLTNRTVVVWADSGYTSVTNVPANATNLVAITAGGNFCAALRADGVVVAWSSSPPSTTGMTNVVDISAGEFPLVALKADGKIVATGVSAPGFSNSVAVAAGRYHAIALQANGTVTNWTGTPTTPTGLTNVAIIASGQSHCLAIIGLGPQPAPFSFTNATLSSNKFSFSTPAQYGSLYSLEYKTSLTDLNWKSLPLNLAVSNSITLTDAATTNVTRFYRVRKW